MKLLLIEDVAALAALTSQRLEDEGFRVDVAHSIAVAEEVLATSPPDVIVLDLGLPDGSGLSLLERLRSSGQSIPVLVVTAQSGLNQRIAGLDLGADDYLGKPAAPAEIAARCRALLRRPGGLLGSELICGNLTLDTVGRAASASGQALPLARREIDVLEVLMRRAGKVMPRAAIEAAIYTFDEAPGPNALEASVSRLRKILAEFQAEVTLHTIRGVGYMLVGRVG